jgi:hypothetical protein
VGTDFAAEAPFLLPLPVERFDTALSLSTRVDRYARITVRQCHCSVPARLIGQRVRVSLSAGQVRIFDGSALVATPRPSYYEAAAALERDGLPGLVPAKPGPRRAHKLTEEIVAYAQAARTEDPSTRAADLAAMIADRFGVVAHPRSVERALTRVRTPKSGRP